MFFFFFVWCSSKLIFSQKHDQEDRVKQESR